MDADKVKIINKWALDDTSKDASIEALIPHYAGVASEYCNQVFIEPYPLTVQEFIAKMIEFHNPGLSSRSMGTVSYSFDNEYEDKLYKLLKPYRKVSWGGK
ncbi:phage head-tail connector protein [Jeotgalicoccus sp. S0W5]|uniref:phage head-tail connector protein n=1 Tax=Jeotgalicoccus sp. S0W5 TaxID=2527874 RepID=UPI001414DF84|nr:phage head-tail connector protein [Jeotgalicoccus sp. S0W5]